MIRIAALNDSSSEDDSRTPRATATATKEAKESEAFTLYDAALGLQRQGEVVRAEKAFKDLLNHGFIRETARLVEDEVEGGDQDGLRLLYSIHKNLANMALQRGELRAAVESYVEAVKIDTTEVTVWYKIGTIALKLFNFPLARLAFEKGLHCNPNHWPCLDHVVTLLYAMNDYWNCLYYISRALEKDQEYTKGLVLRKQILKEQPSLKYNTEEMFLNCDPSIYVTHVDRSETEEYINEALDMRERRRELAKKPDPVPITLPHTITHFTWKNLGECLIELYDRAKNSDPPLSMGLRVDLSEYSNCTERCDTLPETLPEKSGDVQESQKTKEPDEMEVDPDCVAESLPTQNKSSDSQELGATENEGVLNPPSDPHTPIDPPVENMPTAMDTQDSQERMDVITSPVSSSSHPVIPVSSPSNRVSPVSSSSHPVIPVSSPSNQVTPVSSSSHPVIPVSSPSNRVTPVSSSSHPVIPVSSPLNRLTPVSSSSHPVAHMSSSPQQFAPSSLSCPLPSASSSSYPMAQVLSISHPLSPVSSSSNLLIPVSSSFQHFPVSSSSYPLAPLSSSSSPLICVSSSEYPIAPVSLSLNTLTPTSSHPMTPMSSSSKPLTPLSSSSHPLAPVLSSSYPWTPVSSSSRPLSTSLPSSTTCVNQAVVNIVDSQVTTATTTVSAATALQDHTCVASAENEELGRGRGKAQKRKRGTIIDDFGLGVKRRSARVRNTYKQKEEESVNFEELLLAFLPSSLKQVNEDEDTEITVQQQQQTSSNGEEKTTDSDQNPVIQQLAKAEDKDVREFLKENIENGGTINLMICYLFSLAKQAECVWPTGLTDVYLKVYSRIRKHFDLPDIFSLTESEEYTQNLGMTCQLAAEFQLDQWISNNRFAVSPVSSPRSPGTHQLQASDLPAHCNEDLWFVTGLTGCGEVMGPLWLPHCIRVYWMKARFYMLQGKMDDALYCFQKTLEYLEYAQKQEELTKVHLVNCKVDNIISVDHVKNHQESLQRCQSLEETQKLYEAGDYEKVVDFILQTFTQPQLKGKVVTFSTAAPERQSQLILLQNSLFKMEAHQRGVVWGEVSLNEAVLCYKKATTNELRDEWSGTLAQICRNLIRILDKQSDILKEVPTINLVRLARNLIKMIDTTMAVPDNAVEMPLGTVLPWILMYRLIKFEEDKIRSMQVTSSEGGGFQDDMPSYIMLLNIAHEYLGRHCWCTKSEGSLLLFYMDVLQEFMKGSYSFKHDLEQSYEQCVYCLFGHPNKKGRARHLMDHNSPQIDLSWDSAQKIFQYFKPKSVPEFDSYKADAVSGDVEFLLKRIAQLVPDSEKPAKLMDSLQEYIEGNTNIPPSPDTTHVSTISKELYYLLADYYFKNKEQAKAVKFYMSDICMNPTRLDSWAGMALARMSQLEQKLSSVDSDDDDGETALKMDMPVYRKSIGALRCFRRAVEIDDSNGKLWIEYGSLAYQLHSHSSRQLKWQNWFPLSEELQQIASDSRQEMLQTAFNCYKKASECECDENGEEWLQHYMMAKCLEKMRKPAKEYLDHYKKAAEYLYEENATYPKRITYAYTTPHLAVESLEMFYRIHVSILKFLLKTKTVLESDLTLFQQYIDDTANSPFARCQEKRQVEKDMTSGDGSLLPPGTSLKSGRKSKGAGMSQDHTYSKQKSNTDSSEQGRNLMPTSSADPTTAREVKVIDSSNVTGGTIELSAETLDQHITSSEKDVQKSEEKMDVTETEPGQRNVAIEKDLKEEEFILDEVTGLVKQASLGFDVSEDRSRSENRNIVKELSPREVTDTVKLAEDEVMASSLSDKEISKEMRSENNEDSSQSEFNVEALLSEYLPQNDKEKNSNPDSIQEDEKKKTNAESIRDDEMKKPNPDSFQEDKKMSGINIPVQVKIHSSPEATKTDDSHKKKSKNEMNDVKEEEYQSDVFRELSQGNESVESETRQYGDMADEHAAPVDDGELSLSKGLRETIAEEKEFPQKSSLENQLKGTPETQERPVLKSVSSASDMEELGGSLDDSFSSESSDSIPDSLDSPVRSVCDSLSKSGDSLSKSGGYLAQFSQFLAKSTPPDEAMLESSPEKSLSSSVKISRSQSPVSQNFTLDGDSKVSSQQSRSESEIENEGVESLSRNPSQKDMDQLEQSSRSGHGDKDKADSAHKVQYSPEEMMAPNEKFVQNEPESNMEIESAVSTPNRSVDKVGVNDSESNKEGDKTPKKEEEPSHTEKSNLNGRSKIDIEVKSLGKHETGNEKMETDDELIETGKSESVEESRGIGQKVSQTDLSGSRLDCSVTGTSQLGNDKVKEGIVSEDRKDITIGKDDVLKDAGTLGGNTEKNTVLKIQKDIDGKIDCSAKTEKVKAEDISKRLNDYSQHSKPDLDAKDSEESPVIMKVKTGSPEVTKDGGVMDGVESMNGAKVSQGSSVDKVPTETVQGNVTDSDKKAKPTEVKGKVTAASEKDKKPGSARLHKELIEKCMAAMCLCLARFPTHYKALYRLAYVYMNSPFHKNLQYAHDLLLGNQDWKMLSHMPAQGLFWERKPTNFFQGVWKIPVDEIDRSGSFPSHLTRSIKLVLKVLKEQKEVAKLHSIFVQLNRNPDAGKKYMRDAERIKFARLAHQYCLDAIRGRIPELCNHDNHARAIKCLMEVYKVYNYISYKMDISQTIEANELLEDTYKAIMGKKLVDDGDVLEQAIKFCQEENQKKARQHHPSGGKSSLESTSKDGSQSDSSFFSPEKSTLSVLTKATPTSQGSVQGIATSSPGTMVTTMIEKEKKVVISPYQESFYKAMLSSSSGKPKVSPSQSGMAVSGNRAATGISYSSQVAGRTIVQGIATQGKVGSSSNSTRVVQKASPVTQKTIVNIGPATKSELLKDKLVTQMTEKVGETRTSLSTPGGIKAAAGFKPYSPKTPVTPSVHTPATPYIGLSPKVDNNPKLVTPTVKKVPEVIEISSSSDEDDSKIAGQEEGNISERKGNISSSSSIQSDKESNLRTLLQGGDYQSSARAGAGVAKGVTPVSLIKVINPPQRLLPSGEMGKPVHQAKLIPKQGSQISVQTGNNYQHGKFSQPAPQIKGRVIYTSKFKASSPSPKPSPSSQESITDDSDMSEKEDKTYEPTSDESSSDGEEYSAAKKRRTSSQSKSVVTLNPGGMSSSVLPTQLQQGSYLTDNQPVPTADSDSQKSDLVTDPEKLFFDVKDLLDYL